MKFLRVPLLEDASIWMRTFTKPIRLGNEEAIHKLQVFFLDNTLDVSKISGVEKIKARFSG